MNRFDYIAESHGIGSPMRYYIIDRKIGAESKHAIAHATDARSAARIVDALNAREE